MAKGSNHDDLLKLVCNSPIDGIIIIETDPLRIFSKGSIFWRAKVIDPSTPQIIRLFIDNPNEVLEKNIATMNDKKNFAPERSKFQFFKSLTNNAEPFIPEKSLFKSVFVSYQRKDLSLIWWNTDPIVFYFIFVIICSFILKPFVKVNI